MLRFSYLQDGSFITHLGPLNAKTVLVLIGRDNALADTTLMRELVSLIYQHNMTIIFYESPYRKIKLFKFYWSKIIGQVSFIKSCYFYFLQLIAFIKCIHLWNRFIIKRYRRQWGTLHARTESLKLFLQRFLPEQQILLLTQSAGARIASLIADDAGVQRMVCLGYPFRNPEEGDNIDRYRHLETITTPLLIFQGRHDPYGGTEVLTKYKLSPSVTIHFVDTDHDFKLTEQDKKVMADMMMLHYTNAVL